MAQRILVADDEERVVRLLQIRLEALGYEVVPTYDGETALHHAAEGQPDLVLLDVMMPKVDGFEVLRRLKADPATAPIPVIMLTARGQFDDLAHGYGEGAHWYFHKPFDVGELEQFILRLIGPPDFPEERDVSLHVLSPEPLANGREPRPIPSPAR
jgi:DNA-binding response OmpR family regulator